MLNCMNSNIIDALVKVGYFHTVSIFFNETKSPLNSSSERFKLLVDQAVRHCWPIFSVSILKVSMACIAEIVLLFDIITLEQ